MPKIKISVFGAKMLSSPETLGISPETPGFENSGETPGIGPDTPGLGYSGGNSGYRPGNSGLGSPDTPDFWGMFWARECNFCVNY